MGQWRTRITQALVVCSLAAPNGATAQQGSSPPDRPVGMDLAVQACLDSAVGPLVAQARRSFPGFAQKFEAGLPQGYAPSVTVRLTDNSGHFEQVFVTVDSIRHESIYGRVTSRIELVRGYKFGQPIRVSESEILDWTISRPDGTEEGNLLGKYMDALAERLRRNPQRKPC